MTIFVHCNCRWEETIPDSIQQLKSGVGSANNQGTYLCDPVSCLPSYCSSKMDYGKSQSSWGRCYHLWYWDMVPTSWVHGAQVYLLAWDWYEYPKLEALSLVPGVAKTTQHNTTKEQLENKVEVLIPTPFKKCSLCTPPNPITIAYLKPSECVSSANQGLNQQRVGLSTLYLSTKWMTTEARGIALTHLYILKHCMESIGSHAPAVNYV